MREIERRADCGAASLIARSGHNLSGASNIFSKIGGEFFDAISLVNDFGLSRTHPWSSTRMEHAKRFYNEVINDMSLLVFTDIREFCNRKTDTWE